MLAGIALLGVVTATLASWLVERVSAENVANRAATAAQVDALMVEIRALREQLDAGDGGSGRSIASAQSPRSSEP